MDPVTKHRLDSLQIVNRQNALILAWLLEQLQMPAMEEFKDNPTPPTPSWILELRQAVSLMAAEGYITSLPPPQA